MNIKKNFLRCLLSFILLSASVTAASADTLLFPVIAVNQPHVTTIISVMNEAETDKAGYLKYTYRVKDSLLDGQPNITGECTTVEFTRPTYYRDLVSFDAGGIMNEGKALFGDTDPYTEGFSIGKTGPLRGYLLVSHSSKSGSRVNVDNNSKLVGEAVIMDIASGAAWGYKAINDTTKEDYSFTTSGVTNFLQYGDYNYRGFNFFPMNEWTTRFFVTPIGSAMNTGNLEAKVRLSTTLHVIDRTGTEYTFTPPDLKPKCTAAIDLGDMMDSTTKSAVEFTGGFSRFCVQSGGSEPGRPVIAYKLEYVLDNPAYGGTINNGYLLTTPRDMP